LPDEGHILNHLAWVGRLAELSLSPDAMRSISEIHIAPHPYAASFFRHMNFGCGELY
jgi:hypothetical protein